jgi:hypothetical protein
MRCNTTNCPHKVEQARQGFAPVQSLFFRLFRLDLYVLNKDPLPRLGVCLSRPHVSPNLDACDWGVKAFLRNHGAFRKCNIQIPKQPVQKSNLRLKRGHALSPHSVVIVLQSAWAH